MTENIASELRKSIVGEVKNDQMTKFIYSVDASIFEVVPELVVLPKNEEDIQTTVHLAKRFSKPIIPRGGATGIAGGCLGEGIVIDTSKYLNRILDFNASEKWVICEPGIIQDELNAFLAPYNLRLGPETSTSNRATIGGMCATNAAGAHFLKYGNMSDHVLAVEMVLSNGEKRWIGGEHPFTPLQKLQDEIRGKSFLPNVHRSSSGYLIHSLLEDPFNPAKITIGSEGTLGFFTKLKLNLSPKLINTTLVLFPFSSLEEALEKVPEILPYSPISLELLDHHVISFGKLSPTLRNTLDWLTEDPKALLIAEFETEVPVIFSNQKKLTDEAHKKSFWALRKGGLGLLLSRRSYSRAIAFIEDLSMPPEELASFIRELKKVITCDMGVYGHAGEGCLHIRPFVDLRNSEAVDWMFANMQKIATLVRDHNGVLSGEHGDGLIRSWLNEDFFGSQTYEIFKKIKYLFDPLNLMNPGKIVNAKEPKEKVRKNSDKSFPTFLNFENEGGFPLSVDLCNGNGECRKKTGLMCPSFHAFGDERHTTRARAQSIKAVLQKKTDLNEGVLDVLDYCLECKGCKTECPSNVDMAKMKMEMLFQYQEKHGYFFLNRLFGNLPTLSGIGSKLTPFSNWMLSTSITKSFLSLCGITKERRLPSFAKMRFSEWFKNRPSKKGSKTLVLFNDTFTEFHSPHIGIAAVEVLEAVGYTVKVLPFTCCGRPYLSKGILKKAKESALKVANQLKNLEGPLIVLEPSCLSAFRDDYKGLIGSSLEAYSLETFLPPLNKAKHSAFYHPHCHEQAIGDPRAITKIFQDDFIELSSGGCCGLAGSFGYEKSHYPMSMAIGEKSLFPKIRSLSDEQPIIASGFSCRSQIEHGTQKKAYHLAEYYLSLLRDV